MKLNSSQLEAFFTVAKTLNFTRAAEALHISQSALSQRIAKLEEEIETTLFVRDKTSVRLTEAGLQVLRFCQVADLAESDLLTKLKGSHEELAGILKIGGFSSVNRSLVLPALKKLMIKNQRLSIQLFTKELHELPRLLRNAEADYILSNRKSDSPDIENIFLGYEEYILVRSKKHPETDVFLDHDENDPMTTEYFSRNKMSYKPKMMCYLDDIYGLIDGVKNGYGKAILPLHLIEDERELEIVDPKRILRVPVYLQFYLQPYYRRAHSYFLSEIQSYFEQHLRQ